MGINHNNNININTSNNRDISEKTFKYCEKCGKQLEEGSVELFCDFYCKQEFFRENAKELDSCYREFIGRC